MQQCKRVGINVGYRCNVNCRICFYHHFDKTDKAKNAFYPFEQMKPEIDNAKNRGCNHVVFVGEGEPTLNQDLVKTIDYIHSIGMTSSAITNGTTKIEQYQTLLDHGMNHFHVSTHGVGNTLDEILGVNGSYTKQLEFKKWLKSTGKPWRSNTTLQQLNYKQLLDIAKENVEYGCKHFVFLNFLPHYHWNDPTLLRTVAVHPAELKPEIQKTIDFLLENDVRTTIRYMPMCHLDEQYRKYVTNAINVLNDSSEWDYDHCGESPEKHKQSCIDLANGVAIMGKPCSSCTHKIHCGGWNRYYANGFSGAGLTAINTLINQEFGYLFMQNPFNQEFKGWY